MNIQNKLTWKFNIVAGVKQNRNLNIFQSRKKTERATTRVMVVEANIKIQSSEV
jgi:hypothetical protein